MKSTGINMDGRMINFADIEAREKKVGYSEIVNGYLMMYSDDTKEHLLAELELPSGGGNVDDIQVDGESIVDEDKIAKLESSEVSLTPLVEGVSDVTVNGESIVTDGVANIPTVAIPTASNASEFAMVRYRGYTGLRGIGTYGNILAVKEATNTEIAKRYKPETNNSGVLVPGNVPYAVKSAMIAPESTTDPAWTLSEKQASRERQGIYVVTQEEYDLIEDAESNGNIYFIKE